MVDLPVLGAKQLLGGASQSLNPDTHTIRHQVDFVYARLSICEFTKIMSQFHAYHDHQIQT